MESCSTCVADDFDATPHAYARRALALPPSAAFTLTPFVLTYLIAAVFAWQRLFPILSGSSVRKKEVGDGTARHTRGGLRSWARYFWDRAAAISFSSTIALSTVLAELIFCEISDTFDPAARKLALEATITTLLISLIIVTPALEIHTFITAAGFGEGGVGKCALGIALDLLGLALWLAAFWGLGRTVLGADHFQREDVTFWRFHATWFKMEHQGHGLSQGSLERIGIIGISLMAALAGFAAVSSIWQSFGTKLRKVTDTDIARKQSGLEATTELLISKESRLRALERKLSFTTVPEDTFMTRIVGSFRPDTDNQELASLRIEISGLSTMQASLSNALSLMRARRATQQQASTALGRICITFSYVFSFYCLYRITATSLATFHRWWSPHTTFASTDPINNALALIAKLWDPTLDRTAWARQISFLLSGLMLLASFNAVLQTVLLFSRFTPARLLQSAQQNLALLVSQICATYVISSALLLRSNLPKEMGSVIEGALGAPLDTKFSESWFEGWFLGTCIVTAVGIWVSRQVSGISGDWDDEYDGVDVEMGKRNS